MPSVDQLPNKCYARPIPVVVIALMPEALPSVALISFTGLSKSPWGVTLSVFSGFLPI